MPVATRVSGDTSSDGSRIRLQIIVDDGEGNEIVLCRDDVQSVVALLKALDGQVLGRSGSARKPSDAPARPFPVDLITLDDDERGEPVLTFSDGATGRRLWPSASRAIGLPTSGARF